MYYKSYYVIPTTADPKASTDGSDASHSIACAKDGPRLGFVWPELRLKIYATPWERKPPKPDRLSPARVRREFSHIRASLPCLTRVPKPVQPSPGRPPGVKNWQLVPRRASGHRTNKPQNSS